MKYQAQIRHINGDIITTIWDDNKARFLSETKKAKDNLVDYIGCDNLYTNDEVYLVEV